MTSNNNESDDTIQQEVSGEQEVAQNLEQDVIDNLQGQIIELQDKLHRAIAENQNVIQRFKKQIEEAREYAIGNFARDLIAVIDNLARALAHKPAQPTPEVANIIAGVEMTKTELDKVLAQHKVLTIAPKPGDTFDHQLHQALSSEEVEDMAPDTIIRVMQVGYKLNHQLLRPAIVSVSATKES